MKKKILFALMLALMACMLAFSISAADTYEATENGYVIYTSDQYKEVLTGIKDGTLENKTVILGCDIEVKFDFVMDSAVDVTIDLNNYTLKNTYLSNKSGDFDLQHQDAIIRVKNGKMTSSFCMFIFRTEGQVYAENVDIVSKEECFYQYGGHSGVVSLKNCNIDITDSYSAVSLGKCEMKGTGKGTLYQIEGGSFDGLNINCAAVGSYVKDCYVYSRDFKIDSWHGHGESGADVTVEIRNVKVDTQVYLNDNRVDPVMYDCTFPQVDLTGGNQLLISYTSPTCTSAGTKTTYAGADTGTLDEQYSIDNPALGHNADMSRINGVEYESYLANGAYTAPCVRCDETTSEEIGTANALFALIGYSTPEDGSLGIVMSFMVDYEAIAQYEALTGKKLNYGIVAGAKQNLGENNPLDENGNAITLEKGSVIKAEIDKKYGAYDFKLTGLSEEHKNVELVMATYVMVTEGEGTSIVYLQESQVSSGLGVIPYNTISTKQ